MADENDGNGGGGSFLLGLLLGGAIGALAALLYAPQRGDETRNLIAQKSTEYASVAKARTGEVAEALKQNAADVSEKAADVVGGLKAKTADVSSVVTEKASAAVSQVRETAQDLAHKGMDAVAAGKNEFNSKKNELLGDAADGDNAPAA